MTIFRRHTILFLFTFLGFPLLVISQSGVIEGNIHDKSSGNAIEFASVQLIRVEDSSVIRSTVSEKRGRFTIEGVVPGNYIIRCSFIGYDISNTPVFTITSAVTTHNIGRIDLQIEGKSLGEVVVTARKQTLLTGIDRKTYNVDQDIMSRSGSASDILKNIPSVEVDIEGQVLLRGSGDVMILINGKPSPLMGRSRADILQQLPANSIERIEVITNPSARYRPDGVSGIINIVLKKNIKNGFNGTVNANMGNRDRYNMGINLNYRPKKFNLFANYNYRHDTRLRYNDLQRIYIDTVTGAITGYFDQSSSQANHPRGHFAGAGLDYTIDDHNSFGVSGNIYYRKQQRKNFVYNSMYDQSHILTEQFDRLMTGPEQESERSGAAFFNHRFKGDDHELQVEYNFENSEEEEDLRFENIFYKPTPARHFDNTLIKTDDTEHQLTADYTKPIGDDGKLEAGYDGLYLRSDHDFYGEYYDTLQDSFVKDLERSNRFLFNQDIHAVYTTYEKTMEKWGFTVGLRAEKVFTKSTLVTLDSIVTNDYFKIFPTLHLSYAIKQGHEMQLNYSKRVNRPDADDLNPFPEYQDPRNLRSGNPKLLPEIIHSVELGYKWQHEDFSIVPSIYYRFKVNGYTPVTRTIDDTVLLTIRENLSRDRSAGFELIFSAKASTWFSTNLSTNIFYNRIESMNDGEIRNRSIFSMSANLSTNFVINKTSFIQLSTNYRSARLNFQGKQFPTTVVNLGLRQDLFKNKLSVSLTASDLFQSLRQKNILNTNRFSQTSFNRRDGRIVYFGLNYRFGIVKKEKEEKMQFDDNL